MEDVINRIVIRPQCVIGMLLIYLTILNHRSRNWIGLDESDVEGADERSEMGTGSRSD